MNHTAKCKHDGRVADRMDHDLGGATIAGLQAIKKQETMKIGCEVGSYALHVMYLRMSCGSMVNKETS